MTRQLSRETHALPGSEAATTAIAAALQTVDSRSSESRLSSSMDSSIGVNNALLGIVSEDQVWPDLAVTPFARRGCSDSRLLSVTPTGSINRTRPLTHIGYEDTGGRESSEEVPLKRAASSYSFQFPPRPTAMKSMEGEEEPQFFSGERGTGIRSSSRFGGSRNAPSGSEINDGNPNPCTRIGMMATAAPADGFTALLRRRTFTAPDEKRPLQSSPSGDDRDSSNRGNGRVPMSMSEDNMLALLARHPNSASTTVTTGAHTSVDARVSVQADSRPKWAKQTSFERSGSATMGYGSTVGDTINNTGWKTAMGGEATSRAERNSFVMRLHRAGLVKDTCRCVVDIIQGRALQEGSRPDGTAEQPTAKEVQAHLKSLPERYSLTVAPSDVLVHIRLLAEAARTSAGPQVLVTECAISAEVSNVGSRSISGGSKRAKRKRRCKVVVVCRSKPSVLGIISSSVRSAAGTCVDTDLMNTTDDMCLAQLEVEGDWPSVPTADVRSDGSDGMSMNSSSPSTTPHPLANSLSSGFARALAIDEAKPGESRARQDEYDSSSHRSDKCSTCSGSGIALETGGGSRSDLQSPAKKAKATLGVVTGSNEDDSILQLAERPAAPSSSSTGLGRIEGLPTKPPETRPPLTRSGINASSAPTTTQALSSLSCPSAVAPGVDACLPIGADGDGESPAVSKEQSADLANVGGARRRRQGSLSRREGCHFSPTSCAESPSQFLEHQKSDAPADAYDSIAAEELQVLELVGQGRFSRTHRARWSGKIVAMKTVELTGTPAAAAAMKAAGGRAGGGAGPWEVELVPHSESRIIMTEFERELHVVRRLKHPHVCGYLGVCFAPPRFSLVYDFLEHGSLAQRLRNSRSPSPLPPTGGAARASAQNGSGVGSVGGGSDGVVLAPLGSAELFQIGVDVAEGMRYLHEMGVLHRDLKSDNILLDSNDRARIADFGLSCFCNPMREHTAETGTYRWMAPEVIRHEPYSESADIYSFGVVLWEILTKRQPFEGLTPIQAAFAVARQGLRPQLPPEAPTALSALIKRCWDQNANARPSFTQICAELPVVKLQALSSIVESGDLEKTT